MSKDEFTGYIDKKGKEIYVGSVIRWFPKITLNPEIFGDSPDHYDYIVIRGDDSKYYADAVVINCEPTKLYWIGFLGDPIVSGVLKEVEVIKEEPACTQD